MKNARTALIANPIYDSVFKFLLGDKRAATVFLSALTGAEILELNFRPAEQRRRLPGLGLTVFRMDFAARIRDGSGREKLVLIEIQKAKLPDDVMRFRRYLGHQYASPENVVRDAETACRVKPLELFTVYFLGHTLGQLEGAGDLGPARAFWPGRRSRAPD